MVTKPTVGILSQILTLFEFLKFDTHLLEEPYVAKSYQDALQCAGFQVVFINCNIDDTKARDYFDHLDGLLLPGGQCLSASNYGRGEQILSYSWYM